MNEAFVAELEQIANDRVKFDEPLSKYSHYKVGGPATYFFESKTSEEVVAVLRACKEHDVAWAILGGGTNVLINDEGFDGLVMKMANRSVQIDVPSGVVVAEAGLLSASLARQTASKGLTGFEWAIGLPGTIGGAVRGNAGCFGSETKVNLTSVEIYNTETGEVEEKDAAALQMGYRESAVKHSPWVVLRATFTLDHQEAERNLQKVEEVLACRMESQPKNARCAGCAFKNFEFESEDEIAKLKDVYDEDIPPNFLDSKRIPAGWLIDKAGLKGTRVGPAAVSDVHGNFITNGGDATADQIAQLIAVVKTRVRNTFGIQLHEEIQYIGF